jgi:hypothetical protein
LERRVLLSEREYAAFRDAAAAAARRHDPRSDELKRSVFGAVDALKSAALSPDRIVFILRELLATVPEARAYPPLAERLTEWCRERLFGSNLEAGDAAPDINDPD